ncbi:hypothetical protein GOV12_04195 [Candidatus Pacearchaeota archaeon]|nr:hypothetical protein [Candidatus Pacearchaeota archaeon]
MVNDIQYLGKTHYYCEDCKLIYESKKWAMKCEEWCKDNKSCNIEITHHSLKKTLEDIDNGKSQDES